MGTVLTALYRISLLLLLLLSPLLLAVEPVPAQNHVAPIINGNTSPAGGQPWIVALLRKSAPSVALAKRQFCGGALIAPTWVLTAAHCVHEFEPGEFQLLIGREDLAGTGGELLDAAEVIVHPDYTTDRFGADIALVRLQSPSSAQPLPRATAANDTTLTGANMTVYGWGFHSYRDDYDCDLNFIDTTTDIADYWCETLVYSYGVDRVAMDEASVRLASYAQCDTRYREYLVNKDVPEPLPEAPYFSEQLTPNVLCAWDTTSAQSPCFGDSGGPLVGWIGNTQVLLGVVSFGYVADCALQGQLGIYTRVSKQAAFIDDAIGRQPALGFAALCPRRPELEIMQTPQSGGLTRVTATWTADISATGWRLYYANAANPGQAPASVNLPAGQHQYAVDLAAGVSFHVMLQARSAVCDSALSEMEKVAVP